MRAGLACAPERATPSIHLTDAALPPPYVYDGGADAGCGSCEPTNPCEEAHCQATECIRTPRPDGFECSADATRICVANACVDTNRTSPMNRLFNGERNDRTLNDPRANQMANTVEATGAAAACTNDYGVHDMVGNVHEWTDDGSFRGGYYLDTKLNGPGCDYRTTAHAKTYYDYSTGFRCCADEGFEGEE